MKSFLVYILLLFYGLFQSTDQLKIYIIGDSTAANKTAQAYPETGWGMELQSFFKEQVIVDNRALNGRSTKSFINEKRWEEVLKTLQAGDFVFIQFGHNDEKIDRPDVGTSLDEYKQNLIQYIRDTRNKKANPVLLTPIARRNFKNGTFSDTHGGYPNVVRLLADSLKVPLIDMHKKTGKLLSDLGEQNSLHLFNHVDSGHVNYPKGKVDNTHLSPDGAKAVAALVVDGIRELKLSLNRKLK